MTPITLVIFMPPTAPLLLMFRGHCSTMTTAEGVLLIVGAVVLSRILGWLVTR